MCKSLLPLLLSLPAPSPHTKTRTYNPSSGSVISEFYPTSTPNIPAKASTSLASALHSVQSTWLDSPKWTSARDAIYSAAPTAAQSSIDKSGYAYGDIVTQSWYTKNVPKAVQTDVKKEIEAINSAAAKIVGTPSSTSKGGAAKTGVPVAAALGIVGGVLAIL